MNMNMQFRYAKWHTDQSLYDKYIRNLSPIVIFTYNRLEHTKKTIEALRNNEFSSESDLYIYSDGPKDITQQIKVDLVRKYLCTVDGFKSVNIIERKRNLGLANNIIDGVTEIINKYGKIIVLEDDIVTSNFFLRYMNDALELYKEDDKVMEISGYSYPMCTDGLPETMFLHYGDCWGWATWKDCWKYFERNPSKLIHEFSKQDIYHFNLENHFDFWRQVTANLSGELYTWAIFWTAAIYKNKGLMLYPKESLVINIGFDASGDHQSVSKKYITKLKEGPVVEFPEVILEDKKARKYLRRYLFSTRPCLLKRLISKMKYFLLH